MKRKWTILLSGLGMVIVAAIAGASLYFYNYAFVPSHKTFLSSTTEPAVRKAQAWLKTVPKETWHEQAAGANLRLVADWVPASHDTPKTIVVAHGYMNTKEDMARQIKFFHEAGFNVLAPDDRGHGQSQGNYIGYGYADRLDYLKWLQQVIRRVGPTSQIGLYGVSMGGATVMYLSGEKLPKQVVSIVEDCGYTSIMDELAAQGQALFSLPRYPLIPAVALTASLKAHYNVFAASTIVALNHNTRPLLFIHGAKDAFVPTSMVHREYAADHSEKKLWIVPKAGHAQSLKLQPNRYQHRVVGWFNAHWR
ncbi:MULTISPECIES: alpha/beta hydrolase [unclassified Lacticaseibacillus]|uniref:alpha/beta hydrolase n=1 Tax=unclassified Lacticaseibacillus TaxID=2759744 RepID=UPI001943BDB9|nr:MULTISPECIES: alpha/beta hydrolase [unclassified Lacticaseibacillus]